MSFPGLTQRIVIEDSVTDDHEADLQPQKLGQGLQPQQRKQRFVQPHQRPGYLRGQAAILPHDPGCHRLAAALLAFNRRAEAQCVITCLGST